MSLHYDGGVWIERANIMPSPFCIGREAFSSAAKSHTAAVSKIFSSMCHSFMDRKCGEESVSNGVSAGGKCINQ
jgi:hypothetical protein